MKSIHARAFALLALTACLTTCVARADVKAKPPTKIEFYAAFDAPADALVKKQIINDGGEAKPKTVYLAAQPALTTSDIQEVKANRDSQGSPCISLKMTESGGEKMGKISAQQLGNLIAIVVDDEVVTAPKVRSLATRDIQIVGVFSDEWVKQVVAKFERPKPISD